MPAEQDMKNIQEQSIAEIRAIIDENQESIRIQDLRTYAEDDQEYYQLKEFIINSFSNHRSQLPEEIKRYWNMQNQLTDLIVCGCRLVIPTKKQKETLTHLHESPQGSVCTKERAHHTSSYIGRV